MGESMMMGLEETLDFPSPVINVLCPWEIYFTFLNLHFFTNELRESDKLLS